MARPKELLDEELALKAEQELAKLKDSSVCIRLKAIISCKDYPINHVSEVMGFHRSSLWNWIKRFKEGGVEALCNKPKGHNPSKLNEEQKSEIAIWLNERRDHEGNYVHWTLKKLLSEINVVFGIIMGKSALWNVIRDMGYRQKVPRPYHVKADKKKQEEFKKKLPSS